MSLKDILNSFSTDTNYSVLTSNKGVIMIEYDRSKTGMYLLNSGNAFIPGVSPYESAFTEFGTGVIVSGTEDKFIGFAEIVKFPKDIYFPLPIAFDIDLNLTIHSLKNIIYRLTYGGNGGLGAGSLIGYTITPELLTSLKLRLLMLFNTLAQYGMKEKVYYLDVTQNQKDPTLIEVNIQQPI